MYLIFFAVSFCFTFCNIHFFFCNKDEHTSIRYSLLLTMLFLSFFVVITTLAGSTFQLVHTEYLIFIWLFASVVSGVLFFRRKNKHKIIDVIKKRIFAVSFFEKITFFFILLSAGWTLLIAVIAYPNNWDSMTYHLPRIMHWLQNGNCNYFPTHIDRQVTQPPFAEYLMMHFYALGGDDRFFNLVQWMFGVLCIIVVSLISQQCGGSRKTQLIAAFFAAMMPMLILQSSSTQNDLVVSFFILSAVYFLLKGINSRYTRNTVFYFSLSVALACFTKGTAYLFLLPVLFIFGITDLRQKKIASLADFSICIFCYLAINLVFLYQNNLHYANPLGNDYELQNKVISIDGMLSNTAKNISMHFRTPFASFNQAVENIVISFHHLIHTNVNSENYNWKFSPAFSINQTSLQEDAAGSTVHVLFILLFSPLLFFHRFRNKNVLVIFFICISMLLVFSLILKWQIWHVRLQLPILLLLCSILAFIIDKMQNKISVVICFLFFLAALPFIFYNQTRPLIGPSNIFYKARYNQYFATNMQNQKPFFDMSAIIQRNNLKKIGWYVSGDAWEYPMWVLLQDEHGLKMEHTLVQNKTNHGDGMNDQSMIPDGIISNIQLTDSVEQSLFSNYYLTYKNEPWRFYIRKEK